MKSEQKIKLPLEKLREDFERISNSGFGVLTPEIAKVTSEPDFTRIR